MPLLTEDRARSAAKQATGIYKSARSVLVEASKTALASFDVFLSHSIRDAELVLGTKSVLEGYGLTVYVDWITDTDLERDKVSPETANRLRVRMSQSSSLLYLHTESSPDSKWMPWELGYFDALKGRVAVLPLTKVPQSSFAGQEYLGLYPYVDEIAPKGSATPTLWVNRSSTEYGQLKQWVTNAAAITKHAP